MEALTITPTPAQRAFCDAYLADIDRDATRAYRAAHPECRSNKAATTCAAKLLREPEVAAYIQAVDDAARIAFGNESADGDKLATLELLGTHLGMFGSDKASKPPVTVVAIPGR